MQDRERKGELAWWAQEARNAVGLSVEEVVEILGRYDPSTLRHAEANSLKMSQPLWRAIVPLYRRLAVEQEVTLPPLPREVPGQPTTGQPDLAGLIEAMHDLVLEVQRQREGQPDMAEAMRLLTDELREMRKERDQEHRARQAWLRSWAEVFRAHGEERVPPELLAALWPPPPAGAP